jgi:toxin CptA
MLFALWVAGLLSVMLWLYLSRQADWRLALALVAVLGAGGAARNSWTHAPVGQLAWDGEAWRWESARYQTGIAGYDLSVVADFQRRVLVRLENQAHAKLWLWVDRRAMPERWLDLRRAVYSPRKSSAPWGTQDALHAEPLLPVAVSDAAMPPADITPMKP